MVYTSIQSDKIKDIKKLQTKKHRDLNKRFLVEGEHLVNEAYKKGVLSELIVKEGNSFKLGVDIICVNGKVLSYISELDNPSDIMGICFKRSSNSLGNKILLLDSIQDPGNMGTIIRSAVAFGIDTIIYENCADPYSFKCLRASQGMLFSINLIEDNLTEVIIKLKSIDYHIYGTSVVNGTDLSKVNKLDKYAIVMGNEGTGVRKEVLDKCDENIYILMSNECESLNVGVATSIILYELR